MTIGEWDAFGGSVEDDRAAFLTADNLAHSERQLGSMLELMPIGVLIHSRQAIIFGNRQVAVFFGSGGQALRGHHLFDFIASSELDRMAGEFNQAFDAEEPVQLECVIERQDGSSRLMKLIVARLPWDGTPVVQVLLQDITEQRRAEASLRQMTITDELTGAYNRRHALYEASLYLGSSGSKFIPFSVIAVDVDHFKSINDTYGHDAGDMVLKELVNRAHELVAIRSSDRSSIFARMGGEEFLFLLPGTAEEDAMAFADQFRLRISGRIFPLPKTSIPLTVSAGVAAFRPDDRDVEGLLKRADVALYVAKAEGRDQVILAD